MALLSEKTKETDAIGIFNSHEKILITMSQVAKGYSEFCALECHEVPLVH